MATVGKILTAPSGTATSPSGRVEQEERTFEIGDKVLGNGAFGTVMEGVDRKTRSPVAVKIQKEHPAAAIEAHALRLFRHIPHAVRFRADILGSPKSKPEEQKRHIVMDLVRNKDVVSTFYSALTPDIRLTYDERITIAKQSLECLEKLHASGWAFFDFKLSNVIFDRDSQSVRLVDFGGARDLTQKSFLYPATTITHKAPEFILKKPISTSYDIWSFGCVLFTLLTDKVLFHVPVDDIKEENRPHYVLQKIVAQLGKPSFDYLLNSPVASEVFDTKQEFRQKTLGPHMKKWDVIVREEGQKLGWPSEEIELWIDMLGSCLRYENRATATELLKSPLFQNEIGVHLHFNSDRSSRCKMYILRSEFDDESGTLPNDSSFDLKIDIHNSTNKHLHLPGNDNGEYIIVLVKDGISIRANVTLKDGQALDISYLQKDLFAPKAPPSKKNLLKEFDESMLEPETTPIEEEKLPVLQPAAPAQLNIQWLLHQKATQADVEMKAEAVEQIPKQPETPSAVQLRRSPRLLEKADKRRETRIRVHQLYIKNSAQRYLEKKHS